MRHLHDFGALFRKLRLEKKFKLGRLADVLGHAVSYQRAVELGRRKPFKPITIHRAAFVMALDDSDRDLLLKLAMIQERKFVLPWHRNCQLNTFAGDLAVEWANLDDAAMFEMTCALGRFRERRDRERGICLKALP